MTAVSNMCVGLQHGQAVQSLSALTGQHEALQHQHEQLAAEQAANNSQLREAEIKLGTLNAAHTALQVLS